jgi:hypothetical protein
VPPLFFFFLLLLRTFPTSGVPLLFAPLRKESAAPMSAAAAKPDEKAAEVADKEKPVENVDALEVRLPGTPPRPPHRLPPLSAP